MKKKNCTFKDSMGVKAAHNCWMRRIRSSQQSLASDTQEVSEQISISLKCTVCNKHSDIISHIES